MVLEQDEKRWPLVNGLDLACPPRRPLDLLEPFIKGWPNRHKARGGQLDGPHEGPRSPQVGLLIKFEMSSSTIIYLFFDG